MEEGEQKKPGSVQFSDFEVMTAPLADLVHLGKQRNMLSIVLKNH